ncbi:MAG: hypothetical protein Q8P76_01950 [bacterium]|nr:hypothetical protein [bacterium]
MNKSGIALELSVVFFLIMGQIWIWRDFQYLAIPILLLVFVSWRLRGNNLATLGLLGKKSDPATNGSMLMIFIAFWWLIYLIALLVNPNLIGNLVQTDFWLKYGKKILFYLPWALFQQVCANGYFANRLKALTGSSAKTAWGVGLLFAALHFPNPVLMAVTFIGGALSARFFLKGGSIYYLALAHAVLAPTVRMFLDYSLRIGPGFWK